MTKDEAWALLRRHAIEKPSFDMFPAAPYIEAYDQQPDDSPLRVQLIEAMWTLLENGEEGERILAATFLSKIKLTEEKVRRLASMYFSATGTDRIALGNLLSGQPFPSDVSDQIRAAFVDSPIEHAVFASKLVYPDPTPEIWDALFQIVRESDDPAALRAAFSAFWTYDREMELALLLRSKPEAVLRAAARLGPPQRFLEVCGLKPE